MKTYKVNGFDKFDPRSKDEILREEIYSANRYTGIYLDPDFDITILAEIERNGVFDKDKYPIFSDFHGLSFSYTQPLIMEFEDRLFSKFRTFKNSINGFVNSLLKDDIEYCHYLKSYYEDRDPSTYDLDFDRWGSITSKDLFIPKNLFIAKSLNPRAKQKEKLNVILRVEVFKSCRFDEDGC